MAQTGTATLADLFRVQRGVATGGNKFFVVGRGFALEHGFPEQYLRPILPAPRHLDTTVIERDADGYPAIDPQLCLIDCDLPPEILAKRHPALSQYLDSATALGLMSGYLIGKRMPWYKQERREPAPFMCTYMGRGNREARPFRFIWNRSLAIGTNLYLMLYPRAALAKMLREFPERGADVLALLAAVTGRELRGNGRVYGGGLNKIEPAELGRVSAAPFIERWPELAPTVRPPEPSGLFG